MRISSIRSLLLALAMLTVSAASSAQVFVSVSFGPPALPVYVQPVCPGEDYIWVPGYWAWSPVGFYWVPGTWVLAPEPGLLWTPGYWAFDRGLYYWHPGYWGPVVGYYGGIAYGFGYTGTGYHGGYWRDRHFFYNQTVNNVNVTNIHYVYSTTVVNTTTTVNRVSFNGGPGGTTARPTAEQEAAARQRHMSPTSTQMQHEHAASTNRNEHDRTFGLLVDQPLDLRMWRQRACRIVGRANAGFIPTEWYPTALAVDGDDLLIASGKSQGTGPNSSTADNLRNTKQAYIASLLHGSVARVSISEADKHLNKLTRDVEESNLMNGRFDTIVFHDGSRCGSDPRSRAGCKIQHVIYIIKENRTFDQVFGDLGAGDGDPSLTMYGEEITPNQHKLARQFGVLDNFYDSGEVSGDGHVWSTAAITSDYTEMIWQITYRGKERTYDFEGGVNDEYPLLQGIPDVNEPGTGYLWTSVARHGLPYRHYGEFVSTSWCDKGGEGAPQGKCERSAVLKGEPLPDHGGNPPSSPSPYPWPVPRIAFNTPTKPELRSHFDEQFADFRMDYPDQLRADEFLHEFSQFVRDRRQGKDTLPAMIVLRLPNDHTIGTRPGMPRPTASVADNDLAVGRVVDAVSNSPYWDNTAIFILEDDAQNGVDHVDAHRSLALVISKYSPPGPTPFVDHRFYTTVNVIRTMEVLLGLPPMNNNDAHAAVIAPLFSGAGDQQPFTADYRNRDNGLLYEVNPLQVQGGAASLKMDFSRADAVDSSLLNRILWRDAKGNTPMPAPRHTIVPQHPRTPKDDD